MTTVSPNVVIIHLESMSAYLFDHMKESLPFLHKLAQNSQRYLKAFSGATSTDMFRINLFLGSDRVYDYLDAFPEATGLDLSCQANLLRVLSTRGYHIWGAAREDHPCPSSTNITGWGIWDNQVFEPFESFPDIDGSLDSLLDRLLKKGGPFLFYWHDLFSHIQYGLKGKEAAETFHERLAWGYREFDLGCRKIFDKLSHLPSVWIFVGDHGDDFWYHTYNPLLVHGLIPYTTQIHVPMFVWYPGVLPESRSEMISVTEIATDLLERLGLGKENSAFPAPAARNTKIGKIVFAQNLFLNQPLRHLWDRGFAAVSEHYLLLVSNHGMELYEYPIDPFNHNNLLQYFKFRNQNIGKLKKLGIFPVSAAILSDKIAENITKEFVVLKENLIDYLNKKQLALGNMLCNPVPETYFKKIRVSAGKNLLPTKHPILFRIQIQLNYYRSMFRELGLKSMIQRALARLKRKGKRLDRGW